MPVHETETKKPMTFFKVKDGFFLDDKNPDKKITSIEGKFQSVKIEEDPGNGAKIKPYKAVVCYLVDDTDVFRLKFHSDIVFAGSFAARLQEVQPGDYIKIGVWPGSKNDKVSFCSIEKKNEAGEWYKVPYETLPLEEAARTARVIEIINSRNAE